MRLITGLVAAALLALPIPQLNSTIWPKANALATAKATITYAPLSADKKAELKKLAEDKTAKRLELERIEAERKAEEARRAEAARLAAEAQRSTPAIAPRTLAPSGVGSGSCAAEIAKYDWDIGTATAVMIAESGGNPGNVNDNPATGDYSIGCFQINIFGANARSRPSEAALKNAATNVSFAYGIYKSNGSSFIGQWGVCRSKVSCY